MIRKIRGMRDILPPNSTALTRITRIFRETASMYGYREVIPPTIESFELFALKSGEEIKKSMYVFKDKAGREVALRPEVTASIARMFLEELMAKPRPIKVFYIANCFRYEEPQKGRYREFFQAGVELIGSDSILSDAETILLLDEYYERLNLPIEVIIGNVGIYRSILGEERIGEEKQDRIIWLIDKGFLEEALREASGKASNPVRVKRVLEELSTIRTSSNYDEAFREGEKLLKDNYPAALKSLENLRKLLEMVEGATWSKIVLNLGFARGLAYYTGIIYEVKSPNINVSIAGGGRYDGLIELYGGPKTPATGFAIGLDRTLLSLMEAGIEISGEGSNIRVLIVPLVDEAIKLAMGILRKIHSVGVEASIELMGRSLRRTLSYASSMKYTHVILIGRREMEEGKVTIRDMARKTQKTVDTEKLIDEISDD